MNIQCLRQQCYVFLLGIALLISSSAHAEGKVLRAGVSVDLGSVFWANGCTSSLVTVTGVELLSGPPGVQLSVRNEDVAPRQQNCPKVPGGVIVATVGEVTAPVTATIRYRVRYKTIDGPRQSEHAVVVSLQP